MHNVPVRRQAAYTLTEMVIVVTIIALVAAIAVPATRSDQGKQLDLAAAEFAAAIRFARSESVRTGTPHGIHHDTSEPRIRVWRADTATNPATIVYDVYHPVSKQIYDYDLTFESLAAAGTITRDTTYQASCNNPGILYFNAAGTPWCESPDNVLLESFELTFQYGQLQRVVTLHQLTGRVTVQ